MSLAILVWKLPQARGFDVEDRTLQSFNRVACSVPSFPGRAMGCLLGLCAVKLFGNPCFNRAVCQALLVFLLVAAGALPGWGQHPGASLPIGSLEEQTSGLPIAAAQDCGSLEQGVAPWQKLALPAEARRLRRTYRQGLCHLARSEGEAAELMFRQGLNAEISGAQAWRFRLLQSLVLSNKHDAALETLRRLLKDLRSEKLRASLRILLESSPALPSRGPSLLHLRYLEEYFSLSEASRGDHELLRRRQAMARQLGLEKIQSVARRLLWRLPQDKASAGREHRRMFPGKGQQGRPLLELSGADFVARVKNLKALHLNEALVREIPSWSLPPLSESEGRILAESYFNALLRRRRLSQAAAEIHSPEIWRRYAMAPLQVALLGARIQLRRHKFTSALKFLNNLEKLSPGHRALPGLYLVLARRYGKKRDMPTLRHWTSRVKGVSPGSTEAATATWVLIRSFFDAGKFKTALEEVEIALNAPKPYAPRFLARFTYWKARIHQALGEDTTASDTWITLSKLWPSNYYGLMAGIDLKGSLPKPSFRKQGYAEPRRSDSAPDILALLNYPATRPGLLYYALGEEEMGREALFPVLRGNLPQDHENLLRNLFTYLNHYDLLLRLVAGGWSRAYLEEPVTSNPFWEQAFPLAYWPAVLSNAKKVGMSPFFLLAIMREESRFRSDAGSKVGARGLMQLMPGTANWLAGVLKLPWKAEFLENPRHNIHFGSLYLGRMLRQFGWNPLYAAAAYNAGPGSVKKWLKRYGHLPAHAFVERIPFEETQIYVRRVYRSFQVYEKLYGVSTTELADNASKTKETTHP